jgi:hypothetical protein
VNVAIWVPSPVIPNARRLGVAAGAAEPLPGALSMSAVDVAMTAAAAAILFLVPAFIGMNAVMSPHGLVRGSH